MWLDQQKVISQKILILPVIFPQFTVPFHFYIFTVLISFYFRTGKSGICTFSKKYAGAYGPLAMKALF